MKLLRFISSLLWTILFFLLGSYATLRAHEAPADPNHPTAPEFFWGFLMAIGLVGLIAGVIAVYESLFGLEK